MLALVAARRGALDAAVAGGGGVERRLQQERDVRLAHELVVEQEVPQLPAALRVVHRVVEPQLLDEAALAPAGAALVGVRPDDVHLDLARGVAAEPRAVLHEDDPRAVARRGERRADAGETAAGDEDVGLELDEPHVRLGRGEAGGRPRRRDPVELPAQALVHPHPGRGERLVRPHHERVGRDTHAGQEVAPPHERGSWHGRPWNPSRPCIGAAQMASFRAPAPGV